MSSIKLSILIAEHYFDVSRVSNDGTNLLSLANQFSCVRQNENLYFRYFRVYSHQAWHDESASLSRAINALENEVLLLVVLNVGERETLDQGGLLESELK
jgi:hypothetical protein